MLRKKLMPTFNSIPAAAAAGTSFVDLPLGLTYHTLGLEYYNSQASVFDTLLTELRIKINGKTQRQYTAAQLSATNGLMGSAFPVIVRGSLKYNHLVMMLAEPFRKDIGQIQLPAWNIAGPNVRSFQLEVDWAAVGSETSKTIQGYYEAEPARGELGLISKVARQSLGASGTSQDFNLLGLVNPRDYLQQISLFPTGDAGVIKAQLVLNGEIVHDLLDFWQQSASLTCREMVPDASTGTGMKPRYDIVLDFDDPIVNQVAMAGINEAKLHVEYGTVNVTTGAISSSAATGTLTALITTVGPAL